MEVWVIFAAIIAVVGVIAFLVWWFSDDQVQKRKMNSVAQVDIENAEAGLVRIVGEVRVDSPIAAPLSGRPCAYYRVLVKEQRGFGKHKHWVNIIDESDGVEFFIEDGTGTARVLVDHVSAVLDKDANFSSGMFNSAGMDLDAFLMERGHDSKGWVFNKNMRFHEGVVEPGETVCAVGTASWEDDPEESAGAGGGYREARFAQRLVLDGNDDGTPLLLSDLPAVVD